MRISKIAQPGSAIRHRPLAAATQGEQDGELDDALSASGSVIGGFLEGGKLLWRASGAAIEVFDVEHGNKQAAWKFGATSHSPVQVTSPPC